LNKSRRDDTEARQLALILASLCTREALVTIETHTELLTRCHNQSLLRDKNLVPLSRQHQHALALCVRIHRAHLASPAELRAWQSEIQQHFEQEIRYHFEAEERHLFPAAQQFPDLRSLVDELLAEHAQLRDYFCRSRASTLNAPELRSFAETLSLHIRKEERQLFEGMQNRLGPEALAEIGAKIDETLAAVSQACIVPTETKLKIEEPSS
jgi:hemerythrin-like domain-containing protein